MPFSLTTIFKYIFVLFKDKRMVLSSLRVSLGIDSFSDLAEVFSREEEEKQWRDSRGRKSGGGRGWRESNNSSRRRTSSAKHRQWRNSSLQMFAGGREDGGKGRERNGGSCGSEALQQQVGPIKPREGKKTILTSMNLGKGRFHCTFITAKRTDDVERDGADGGRGGGCAPARVHGKQFVRAAPERFSRARPSHRPNFLCAFSDGKSKYLLC